MKKFKILKFKNIFFYVLASFSGVATVHGCDNSTIYDTDVAEFIQITIARLDAGIREVESIRITKAGLLETATWSESGFLSSVSDPVIAPAGLFEETTSYLSQSRSSKAMMGQRALAIDLAYYKSTGVEFITLNEMPEGLGQLITNAQDAAPSRAATPGRYIWTAPYSQIGTVDIDITGQKCSTTLACTIANALSTGQLIVLAPVDIDEFLSGSRLNRVQFGAETAAGRIRFGVLSAR